MIKNDGMPFNLSDVDVEIADGTVRVPERRRDPGSQANETADGLDPETEALRHATTRRPVPLPRASKTHQYLIAAMLPRRSDPRR